MENFLTQNDLLTLNEEPFTQKGKTFNPKGFWRGVLSQMQGFCLALYRRNIEIFRGLGTRQLTQQLGKKTAKKRIELTYGQYTIVDAEDYRWLNSFKWCATEHGPSWYAQTLRRDGVPLSMHRLILDAPKGLFVDHIDHNGLNNRKSNLRLCTSKQNQRNRRPSRGKSSKYKGVSWIKSLKKFRAVIWNGSKNIFLGYFDDEIDAAKAYDKKAKELFGEFAYLNFPNE